MDTDASKQDEIQMPRLLKPSDVAKYLGVSRSWVYEAAADGRLPAIRLGGPDGPLRLVEADLVAWLERARSGWTPGESAKETAQRAAGQAYEQSSPEEGGAERENTDP